MGERHQRGVDSDHVVEQLVPSQLAGGGALDAVAGSGEEGGLREVALQHPLPRVHPLAGGLHAGLPMEVLAEKLPSARAAEEQRKLLGDWAAGRARVPVMGAIHERLRVDPAKGREVARHLVGGASVREVRPSAFPVADDHGEEVEDVSSKKKYFPLPFLARTASVALSPHTHECGRAGSAR